MSPWPLALQMYGFHTYRKGEGGKQHRVKKTCVNAMWNLPNAFVIFPTCSGFTQHAHDFQNMLMISKHFQDVQNMFRILKIRVFSFIVSRFHDFGILLFYVFKISRFQNFRDGTISRLYDFVVFDFEILRFRDFEFYDFTIS